MKNTKSMRFFAAAAAVLLGGGGILGLLLSGCFSPVTTGLSPEIPGVTGSRAGVWEEPDPFTVKVQIGEGEKTRSAARSIAGPVEQQLAQGPDSIRNFGQLIVVNAEDKTIVTVIEKRRTSDDPGTEFTIRSLPLGKEYYFLMLMGHWERDYKKGDYEYLNDKRPTLLSAGCVKKKVLENEESVTIAVYHIQVDTQFIPASPHRPIEPLMVGGQPQDTLLYTQPESWEFNWRVRGEGAYTALKEAQGVEADPSLSAGSLKFKSQTTEVTLGVGGSGTPVTGGGAVLVWDKVDKYFSVTGKIGKVAGGVSGYGYFNLEYVPFGKFGAESWANFSKDSLYPALYGGEGGGGVPVWIIRNGINDSTQDEHTYFDIGKKWDGTVNGNGALRFLATDINMNIIESAVFTYYVASTGNDANDGSKNQPLATVREALKRLKTEYGTWWGGFEAVGCPSELKTWAYIFVQGPVTHEPIVIDISITHSGTTYSPAITLCNYSGDESAELKLVGTGSLITVETGGNLTLGGALTLTSIENNSAPLVTVEGGGTFAMSGGTISGNSAGNGNGGGVAVSGTFTMSGGTISGNSAGKGGGVYVYTSGKFTKTGGVIYGGSDDDGKSNTAANEQGHAVFIDGGGTYNNTLETKDTIG